MRALNLMSVVDENTSQLLFFYELCKAGAVKIDRNNIAQQELLKYFGMTIRRCQQDLVGTPDRDMLKKAKLKNKLTLYGLILHQLAKGR